MQQLKEIPVCDDTLTMKIEKSLKERIKNAGLYNRMKTATMAKIILDRHVNQYIPQR